MTKSFREKVLLVVKKIPKGKTLSYKEVAKRAGHALAARSVGAIMRSNHDPRVPCHRVIKSDGTLGGYNGGLKKKIALLRKEGAIK
ncbi:MAG TPA: MGMT family protein [Candidatus Paceibacterota bacterium]|jgi:O-6-methylguanine DNA methyltransferase|nr:MGMT family protein [Candidatus Paceibacterota bacterium]